MQSQRAYSGMMPLLALFLFFPPKIFAKEPVRAAHGMVVAQEPIAADVGLAVLKGGGNAVDAAVAVGFALAVTHPYAGNIGGGGFMLIPLGGGSPPFFYFFGGAPRAAARHKYFHAPRQAAQKNVDRHFPAGGAGGPSGPG